MEHVKIGTADYVLACQAGDLRAAAQALIDMGQRPVILQTDSTGSCKVPFDAGAWGRRTVFKRMETLDSLIERGGFKLGLGLQPTGNLAVLDLDCPDKDRDRLPEVLARAVELLFGGEVPETFEVHGKGGSHLWFTISDNLRDKWAEMGLGKKKIELAGGGAVEVFMPTPDGQGQYQVATAPSAGKSLGAIRPIQPMPASLEEYLIKTYCTVTGGVEAAALFKAGITSAARERFFDATIRQAVTKISNAPKGTQHDTIRNWGIMLAGYAVSLGQVHRRVECHEEAMRAAKAAGASDNRASRTWDDGWEFGLNKPAPLDHTKIAEYETARVESIHIRTGKNKVIRRGAGGAENDAGEAFGDRADNQGDRGSLGSGEDAGGAEEGGAFQVERIRFNAIDPADIARAFVSREIGNGRPIRFWRGEIWQYRRPRYVPVDQVDGWMNDLKAWMIAGLSQNPGEDAKHNPIEYHYSASLMTNVLQCIPADERLRVPENPPESRLFWINPEAKPDWWPVDQSNIVACGNGFLDMTNGHFLEPTPDLFSSTDNEIEWRGPDQPCPKFEAWLESVQPDAVTRRHLGWLAGYVASGMHHIEKAFYLYGPRRSGKGSFLRFLTKLVGTSGTGATTLSSLNTEFGLAGLSDKKLITFGDMRLPKGTANVTQVVERVLMITGGDALPVREMRKDPVYRRINAKIVAASNVSLHLPDESGTIADRFHTFGFGMSFVSRVKYNLDGQIWAEESSGILSWAVKSFQDFVEAGADFPMNGETESMVQSMTVAADPMIDFIQECLMEVGSGSEGIELDCLRATYDRFAIDHHPGEKRISRDRAIRVLKANGITVARPRLEMSRLGPFRVPGWALNPAGLDYLKLADLAVERAKDKADLIKAQLDRLQGH